MTRRRQELEVAALAAIELSERIYKKDFWAWCCDQVQTMDEATQQIRRFPRHLTYLQDVAEVLTDTSERLIAIPKSRRTFISWMMSCWVTWTARYQDNHAILIQSETESKAAFLVDKRCVFIEEHLVDGRPRPFTALKTQEGLIGKVSYTGTGSWILAVAQGPNVLRSYTPSILIIDEADFQPQAPLAVAAALPLVEKKTKLVLVSSSNGPGMPLAEICKSVDFYKWGE